MDVTTMPKRDKNGRFVKASKSRGRSKPLDSVKFEGTRGKASPKPKRDESGRFAKADQPPRKSSRTKRYSSDAENVARRFAKPDPLATPVRNKRWGLENAARLVLDDPAGETRAKRRQERLDRAARRQGKQKRRGSQDKDQGFSTTSETVFPAATVTGYARKAVARPTPRRPEARARPKPKATRPKPKERFLVTIPDGMGKEDLEKLLLEQGLLRGTDYDFPEDRVPTEEEWLSANERAAVGQGSTLDQVPF